MQIKSPAAVIATANRQFFARLVKLLDEGCGPAIAVIGLMHIVLALIYLNAPSS